MESGHQLMLTVSRDSIEEAHLSRDPRQYLPYHALIEDEIGEMAMDVVMYFYDIVAQPDNSDSVDLIIHIHELLKNGARGIVGPLLAR